MEHKTINSRIVENTTVLYIRMILTLGVSLYTVRIVLKILGVEDYGIYNVVGGIVSMLSFITNSMAVASQRYYSYELGRGNDIMLNRLFMLSIYAYLGISIVVLVVCETIGLWFLNNKMNIPDTRMIAAHWVFQSAIFSFLISILTTPYISIIFAYERMKIYAYVAIIEAGLKLAVVYLLALFSWDKLQLYAILMLCSQVLVSGFYVLYCRKYFEQCRYILYWNGAKLKEMLSFAFWNMIGAFAGGLQGHGVNILINLFFNPAVNAARTIAFQMQSAVNSLSINFYNAVAPQITKLHSSNRHNEMIRLVFMSSKLSFFLIMILSVPMLIETPYILGLWLGEVPEYSVLFTRLVILELTIIIFNYPLNNALYACGKVKQYRTWESSLLLLIVPLSYIALKIIEKPEIPFWISIIISAITFIPRLYFVHKFVALSVHQYLKQVVLVSYRVLFVASLPPLFCYIIMKDDSFYRLMVVCVTSGISSAICIYWLGLNLIERNVVKKYARKLLSVKIM